MQLAALGGEAAEGHLRKTWGRRQGIDNSFDGDFGGPISREAKDAGRNRRKRNRSQIAGAAKLNAAAIARRQMGVLSTVAAIPDRTNGMDHVLRREPITLGDLGITRCAAVECSTLVKQFGPGRVVDRAVDAAAPKQRGIGRVDDGVNAERRDVGNDDVEPRLADPARGQGQAATSTGMPLSANSCCNSPAWNISRMMSQPPTNSPFT
ncbi:hypothetical protein BRSPCE3_67340 [Bradyrhizobium sp. Ce-3]|nr:hypothetical protein BRSPCE3_67340 [Bradyrhizobium sp. Ce-3]